MSADLIQEFIKAEILVAKAGERRLLADRAEQKYRQASEKLDRLFNSIDDANGMTESQNNQTAWLFADLLLSSIKTKMYRDESIAMAKQATEIYQRLC